MTANAPGGQDQLSISTRRALQFAWAAAVERTGGEPASTLVSAWDLLVGVMLSHPGTSAPEQMFRHYQLVAGQALPQDYPRLTAEALNRNLAALATRQVGPPLDQDCQAIIRDAVSVAASGTGGGIIHMAAVWAALLGGEGEAAERLSNLLSGRGVNTSMLAAETRTWAMAGDNGGPYQEILNHFPAVPVDLINYKADQPPDGTGFEDLVGIGAEVDAFAYLLASRSLQPPLAVGLFGAWGSGKTYFMEAMQRRIDQLIEAEAVKALPQRQVPFWKRIVHVEFNAWHYAEGDLWSSLVDHIFTQLNLASEKITDNRVEERQRYLLGQLEATSAELKRLADQKEEVEKELGKRIRRVQRLQKLRDKATAELERQREEKIVAKTAQSSKGAVIAALKNVPLGPAGEHETLGGAMSTLAEARAELSRGSAVLRPFLTKGEYMLPLLVALAVGPVLAWAIDQVAASPAAAGFAGLSGFVAVAGGALGAGTRWVRSRLDEIAKASAEVQAELQQATEEWTKRVEKAEALVQKTNEHLEELKGTEAALQERLAGIERSLAKKPQEMLSEFLRDRLEAGEYRKRLGVSAIIQRDFKGLGDLIRYQNAYLLAEGDNEKKRIRDDAGRELLEEDDKDPRIINRIILYIDDLDRCPDGKVIEVLQAVHMLLAFPLFVVVVSVDSRWLAHALQTRYPALAGATSISGEAAAPDDYLEKIFQIPFWVRPLGDEGRRRIVHGLLGGHIRSDGQGGARQANEEAEIGADEEAVLREMVEPRSAPPLLDATALTVSREDLTFLDGLAPLMGETPRSVKRFVNVYQLVKILRRGRADISPYGFPSDERLIAFMLALAEGLPSLSWRLFDQAATGAPETPLEQLIDGVGPGDWEPERKRLRDWLEQPANAGWKDLPSQRLAAEKDDVRRFLFRLVPPGTATSSAPRAQLVHVIQDA